MSTESDAEKWDRRRRNLAGLIGYKGTTPSAVSKQAGYSVNTLSKFLRGETKTLSWDTLERICDVLDLPSPAILDTDNPFSQAKLRLYQIINEMSDDQAAEELRRLQDLRS